MTQHLTVDQIDALALMFRNALLERCCRPSSVAPASPPYGTQNDWASESESECGELEEEEQVTEAVSLLDAYDPSLDDETPVDPLAETGKTGEPIDENDFSVTHIKTNGQSKEARKRGSNHAKYSRAIQRSDADVVDVEALERELVQTLDFTQAH